MRLTKITLFTFFLFLFKTGVGQVLCGLKMISDVELNYQKEFISAEKRKQEIEKQKLFLMSEGYISAYVNSEIKEDNVLKITFETGKKYEWNVVLKDEKVKQILGANDFPIKITPYYIREKARKILDYCENNGFPFATVKMDEIAIIENKINAILKVDFKDYYLIDSIEIKGETKTSRNFIIKTMEIDKGDFYQENKIKSITSKINSVSFLESIRSPEVYFTKGKATLVLYVKDKGTSQFNGILGLNSDKTTGNIEIIGDVNINLKNVLKSGERIFLEWEKVKNNSQKYVLGIEFPYLFRTRFGVKTNVNYYRQDSSFANLDANFGLNYRLNSRMNISVFGKSFNSTSLLQTVVSSAFPEVNSMNTWYYGVGFEYQKLDYAFNPRKGMIGNVEFMSGSKNIVKDNSVTDVLYQKLEDKIVQQKIKFDVSWFVPFFNNSTVLIQAKSENIVSNQLFENELIQIGGLKTIRGFNEQSILASNYYILTTEYRYLFSKNSAVFTFFDYGYYENKANQLFVHDTPLGFGIGVNFATKSGIFTLNYGLGKQNGNPILIKNGKIHFGFVSIF